MYTFNDHQTVSRCSVTSEAQFQFLNRRERFVYEAALVRFCIHLSAPFTSIPLSCHTLLHLHANPTVRTHRQRMGTLQHLMLFLNLGHWI